MNVRRKQISNLIERNRNDWCMEGFLTWTDRVGYETTSRIFSEITRLPSGIQSRLRCLLLLRYHRWFVGFKRLNQVKFVRLHQNEFHLHRRHHQVLSLSFPRVNNLLWWSTWADYVVGDWFVFLENLRLEKEDFSNKTLKIKFHTDRSGFPNVGSSSQHFFVGHGWDIRIRWQLGLRFFFE